MRRITFAVVFAVAGCQLPPPSVAKVRAADPVVKRPDVDLEEAIDADDAEAVRRILEADRSLLKRPLFEGCKGETPSPLHRAAYYHRNEVVKVLLELGASPNANPPRADGTPLMAAASGGPNATAELLLASGAELDPFSAAALGKTDDLRRMLDAAERSGWGKQFLAKSEGENRYLGPLLNWAVAANQYDTAKLLLERGANPNPCWDECCIYDESPLQVAVRQKAWHMITLLMKHGANAELRDSDGETPLHKAITQYDGTDFMAVALLILNGAKQTGRTTWHAPRPSGLSIPNDLAGWNPCEGGLPSDLRTLPRSRETGETPLHTAAKHGLTGTVLLMLLLGVDPNPSCVGGQTPLDFAVMGPHADTAKLLRGFGGRSGNENRAFGELCAERIERPVWMPPGVGETPNELLPPRWMWPKVTPELLRTAGAAWGKNGPVREVWYRDKSGDMVRGLTKPLRDAAVPPVWFGR